MGLPGARLARLAAGTALHVAATGVGVAAGTAALAGSLVAPPVRQVRSTAGAAAESAVYTATVLAKAGTRAAGALVAAVDDATDGGLERVAEAGRAMFEPPDARRSRRVWVSRGRAHLELATPAVEGGPSVRRALRRQLERLDGVEWAAVNDAVGRVLVTFDERRVRVDDVVDVITAIEQARGGTQVFPLHPDHPADLEPLVAAIVTGTSRLLGTPPVVVVPATSSRPTRGCWSAATSWPAAAGPSSSPSAPRRRRAGRPPRPGSPRPRPACKRGWAS